ncbi:FAD-dependent oxidoreductase [Ktedonobacter robiniae]|uniref:FAD-binding domain-containing protein n=1 Tax=Ktedonobacter robiniae TaxID=2778365 RepID=A0ABQ3V3Z8_9CHLR|nr:FAD-dependent monooxygenase [Ktedonobacter robiniae]GHO59200.1 hypothetical protein KSB_76750 [Ktedonobacter robiniae]
MRAQGVTSRTHAIVIGGGIAGLVTARVLLKHYERVTVIERDHYPEEPVFRPGVPQGRHVHTILLRGQRVLEDLFPALKSKLLVQGAIERDYAEGIFYYGAPVAHTVPPVLVGWNASRVLLEWQIRQELVPFEQIHFLEGQEVIGLVEEKEQHRIVGVRVRERKPRVPGEEEHVTDLQADLVVDASGRDSHAPQWLQMLGHASPEETTINTYLGYATRAYEPVASIQHDWKSIAIQATTEQRRGGVLMVVEGGQWMIVLAGVNKDYPPTDDEGFLAFAKSLPDTSLYEAMKEATPISPIYSYRRTENRWRHFERLQRQPEGFLVLGDAACCFNPIYGQGMTVAILEAQVLDACLKKTQRQLTRTFQRKVARVIAGPWQLATMSDAPSTNNVQAKGSSRLLQRYVERVIALLPKDPKVFLTFLEVLNMLRSPLALFHPAILIKVLTTTGVAATQGRSEDLE